TTDNDKDKFLRIACSPHPPDFQGFVCPVSQFLERLQLRCAARTANITGRSLVPLVKTRDFGMTPIQNRTFSVPRNQKAVSPQVKSLTKRCS
ncbi:MAG: hypothetical protein WBX38_18070, partial [Candidatus Sulfotelmatobacter sp.]